MSVKLYRHYGPDGALLYVGISLSVIARQQAHFANSPWVESIVRIEIEPFETLQEAQAAECRAIKTERPKFNRLNARRRPAAEAATAPPLNIRPLAQRAGPTHPGTAIGDILDDIGVSMRTAARAMGLSTNGFNKVLRGECPVTAETALLVGAYFQGDPRLWLNMQTEYDLWHARAKLKDKLAKIVPAPREPKAAA